MWIRNIFIKLLFALVLFFSPGCDTTASSPGKTAPTARIQNELPESTVIFDHGSPIYIRIYKKEKQLELWRKKATRFYLYRTYRVCTYGGERLGPKLQEGDGIAPEGFYFVTKSQLNPHSRFHLSFNIGYPNRYDRHHRRTGSAIMVHGDCVSIGCYAMTDKRIEEIYALAKAALDNGQPFFRVHIFPFRMTQAAMKTHSDSKWYPFWENLKEGYDFFKQHGYRPPNVEVVDGRYVFDDK